LPSFRAVTTLFRLYGSYKTLKRFYNKVYKQCVSGVEPDKLMPVLGQ
jgi:hypothetical protein